MGENANDRFERLAAEFFAATGMLAPGKDQPGAMGGSREDYDRRVDAWRAWNAERTAQVERDAERLAWLIAEGYVTGLRRYSDDSWTLEVDIDRPDFAHTIKAVQGATWREAVDNAIAEGAAVAALVTPSEGAENE